MTSRNNSEFGEVFVISVAAELSGMHAQTLRTYDRLGLVTPSAPVEADAGTPALMWNYCVPFNA